MDYRRYLVEIGTGVDLHGMDETKAAQRAVKDAISHCSMVGLGSLFKFENFFEMEEALMIDVTVATPNPDKVNADAVLSILPEGKRRISLVKGGLQFPTEKTATEAKIHSLVMSNACIIVLIDVDRAMRK